MSSFCLLTIGTRDVQVPEESFGLLDSFYFKDTTQRIKNGIIRENRTVCAELLSFIDEGMITISDLRFPMAEAFVNYCLNEKLQTPEFLLVSTDQEKTNSNEAYWLQDTLYSAQLVKQYIQMRLPASTVEIYNATGNVSNMQHMYMFFKNAFTQENSLFQKSKNLKSYFMLQGGLDQINYSLLLLAIENFNNSEFLGLSEGQPDVRVLDFPNTFKKELNLKNIKTLLSQYQFYGAIQFFDKESISYLLSSYAHQRLMLNHEKAMRFWGIISNRGFQYREMLGDNLKLIEISNTPEEKTRAKILDIYLSAKIFYEIGDTTSMMLRFYMLLESFFSYQLLKVFADLSHFYNTENANNKTVNKLWLEKIETYPGLKEKILNGFQAMKFDKKRAFVNPNTYSAKFIFQYFVEKGEIEGAVADLKNLDDIFKSLEQLRKIRNDISHEGKSVSIEEINKRLRKRQTHSINHIEGLFSSLDSYLSIKNMMHFDVIKNLIINYNALS